MSHARADAARVIVRVLQGQSLTEALAKCDSAWIKMVSFGVCRYFSRLTFIINSLLKKPLKAKDQDIYALLLVGLYQLMEMRTPPHAALAETVNACDELQKNWAKALVNAILRHYLREQQIFTARVATDPAAHFAHRSWWIDKIKNDWPEDWQSILTANNEHPPFALRVNTRCLSRDAYLAKLPAAEPIAETPSGIILREAVPVCDLPGFAEGEVTVQDGAAQLAAELMDLQPGQRVLDAAAAPGGKLTHLRECEPNLAALIAVEKDPARLKVIQENLARLHCEATLVLADARETKRWWDGKLFERILLDAPCSASGVIRRHPDIKLLRQLGDIKALSHLQRELLEALWPLLAPQGMLVYATCSIFPEENHKRLAAFLNDHPDAKEEKILTSWGIALPIGRQILPGMHHMDGFYYARIKKL